MTTRYLCGGSLKDLIVDSRKSDRCLPVDEILRISAEIASGLAHIHACRILYLDLQPKNVLFDTWHKIRLVDFDTAVSFDDAREIDLSYRPLSGYMAPELLVGRGVDERADLYSLGATIYEMCQGRCVFTRPRAESADARGATPLPPLERDDLPEPLRALVFCLLASEPEHRPTSAAEVVERLECIRAGNPAPGHSQPFPQPDPSELRASAGTKAADYAVGDVIDDRFAIINVLGEGGFSKVYHVRDDVEGEERAFKLFDNAAGYEAVRREVSA
jgi:serine/threonine protein kinase